MSPSANVGDTKDVGSISELRKSPGVGNDNPFQYSCLENSMDGRAWWAIIHGGCGESDMIEHTHTFCKLKHVMHTQGQQHWSTLVDGQKHQQKMDFYKSE